MIVSWTLEEMLADLGYEVVGPAARVNEALAMIEAGGYRRGGCSTSISMGKRVILSPMCWLREACPSSFQPATTRTAYPRLPRLSDVAEAV